MAGDTDRIRVGPTGLVPARALQPALEQVQERESLIGETDDLRAEALSPATVLRLQRLAGNQAVHTLLGHVPAGGATIQRKVENFDGEQVDVANDTEKAEAEKIIKNIKDTYGITVSSTTTVEGIKGEYTNVPKAVTDTLKTRTWRMMELRALQAALGHYAPIVGAERAKSTRKGADQEVTSVGKVEQAIDANTPAGKLDTTTLGEYFASKKNMGLFKASEGYKVDFTDEKDQLTGTFVHEIAHGLLKYAIPDFIKTATYWTDANTASGAAGAEAPITTYGATNASEDLSETAMMYFVAPKRLKDGDGKPAGTPGNPCPQRSAFMEKLGKDWVPPPAAAPQVKPEPEKAAATAAAAKATAAIGGKAVGEVMERVGEAVAAGTH